MLQIYSHISKLFAIFLMILKFLKTHKYDIRPL